MYQLRDYSRPPFRCNEIEMVHEAICHCLGIGYDRISNYPTLMVSRRLNKTLCMYNLPLTNSNIGVISNGLQRLITYLLESGKISETMLNQRLQILESKYPPLAQYPSL